MVYCNAMKCRDTGRRVTTTDPGVNTTIVTDRGGSMTLLTSVLSSGVLIESAPWQLYTRTERKWAHNIMGRFSRGRDCYVLHGENWIPGSPILGTTVDRRINPGRFHTMPESKVLISTSGLALGGGAQQHRPCDERNEGNRASCLQASPFCRRRVRILTPFDPRRRLTERQQRSVGDAVL